MRDMKNIEDFNSKIKRIIITKEEIDEAIKKPENKSAIPMTAAPFYW